jgi:hypothetical protein
LTTAPKFALGAAAVIAVVVAGSILVGPAPSPAASPSPSPSPVEEAIDLTIWEPYTSPYFGYSAAFPPGWAHRPASVFWTIPAPTGSIDVFYREPGPLKYAAASMRVPEGMTDDEWIDAYRLGQIDPRSKGSRPIACYPPPEDWSPVMIDGRPAGLRLGCGELEAIMFAGGRVYVFAGWTTDPHVPGVTDRFRTHFDTWLTTITLDPASALEPPAASPSVGPSPSPG